MQVKRSSMEKLMRGLNSAKNLISRVNKKALVSINIYVHMNMHMNELHRCIYKY